MCHDMYTSFLAPVLPLLIKKLELSYTSAGFISVLLRLPSLANPFIGAYAERLNLKYIVVMSPTVTAVAMCLMGSTDQYVVLAALALLAGIGSSCFHVPTPVILKELSGRRIGMAMSSFQIGGELSRTLGPMVVIAAVTAWSVEGIYRLIPAGVMMSVIFLILLRKYSHVNSGITHGIGGSITETLRSGKRIYAALAGITLTKCFSASVIAAYLPVYMTARGESLWAGGGALSVVQASAIAGVLSTGTLSDIFGCRRVLTFLTITAPVTMILFVYSEGFFMFVTLVFAGLTAFSSSPVILSLIQKQGFQYPSIANGVFMTINFMLSSIMILLAGKVSDLIGIQNMFHYFAFASMAGVPFLLLLNEQGR